MQELKLFTLNRNNISNEHICCAFSDKKCQKGYQAKKEWLKDQFEDGFTFRKLDVRGKVFIEYVPVEKGWEPIIAPGCMLINCFWVSGRFKKQGHAKSLLNACIQDVKEKGMKGIVAIAGNKKKPFLSDKKFYILQGFEVCDFAEPYFELLYLPFENDNTPPKFKESAKLGTCDNTTGVHVYYSPACPFNDYYVNTELVQVCEKRNIPLEIHKLDTREKAQNHFVPHTIYSVFYEGQFKTQHVLNETCFDTYVFEK